MKLRVSNPFVKTLKSDKSARIELDLDDPNELAQAISFSQMATGPYLITIEPYTEKHDRQSMRQAFRLEYMNMHGLDKYLEIKEAEGVKHTSQIQDFPAFAEKHLPGWYELNKERFIT